MPVEILNPIAFDRDIQHASYDRDYVTRLWRILLLVDAIFEASGRASSAKTARCISFGEVSTSRSRGFPDGALRSEREPTESRGKRIRMR